MTNRKQILVDLDLIDVSLQLPPSEPKQSFKEEVEHLLTEEEAELLFGSTD